MASEGAPGVSSGGAFAGALATLAAGGTLVLCIALLVTTWSRFGPALVVVAGGGWLLLSSIVLRALHAPSSGRTSTHAPTRPDAHPHARFGAANAITSARAGATLLLAGLVPQAALLGADDATAWNLAIFGIVIVSLMLDGLDGHVARLQGLASGFGARFDMETDALLALVLALLLWRSGTAGAWVLGLGALRYAFLGAMRVEPRLRAPLYPSFRRKLVCVVQIATLCAMFLPPVPDALKGAAGAVALLLLAGSFARDTAWLLARER